MKKVLNSKKLSYITRSCMILLTTVLIILFFLHYVTGRADSGDSKGMNGHLTKPVTSQKLIETIIEFI